MEILILAGLLAGLVAVLVGIWGVYRAVDWLLERAAGRTFWRERYVTWEDVRRIRRWRIGIVVAATPAAAFGFSRGFESTPAIAQAATELLGAGGATKLGVAAGFALAAWMAVVVGRLMRRTAERGQVW